MSEKKSSTPVSGNEKPRTQYKALVGLDWSNRRVEPGDIVEDIPAKAVEWLLESNCIEEVK